MELTDNQEPCGTGKNKRAFIQTTTEVHQQPLRDRWQETSQARFKGLIDEGLIELVYGQMYCCLMLEPFSNEKRLRPCKVVKSKHTHIWIRSFVLFNIPRSISPHEFSFDNVSCSVNPLLGPSCILEILQLVLRVQNYTNILAYQVLEQENRTYPLQVLVVQNTSE